MSACLSCRGLGCSACQTYTVGRLTFDFSRDRPTPSLSKAIAEVIERTKHEPDRRSAEAM